ncbi:DUF2304 family protein [Candidatus Woesearchaeota archaeon]|nr:DUF2304 family protein [Candidatus Woesearchaeota archaeon]MBW3021726.1 DUF2304 family protein [Candidatus Woesearchaeota archaeon]
MVMLLQIVGVLFALGMMFLTYLHFRRKEFYVSDLIVWVLIWFGFIFVVLFPEVFRIVLQTFAIQGPLWFITIAAIIFLTILVFYLHFTVRKTQRKVRHMVKAVALRDADNEKNNDSGSGV